MIPRETIDEILARADIGQLIGQYVTLKPSGKDLKGLCPFHTEKTPSFVVHPDRGFYKCFGCGEAGGPIQFLMKIENVSFPDAVRILAERTGVSIQATPGEKRIITEKEALRKILKASTRFYHEVLLKSPLGKTGMAYLKRRGLSDKTIQAFQLGFAPAGGDFLIRHLRNFKIDYEVMEKAGVSRRGGRDHYDYFRDRVIFPIHDSQGRPIALAGRGLTPDSIPKYLNTPESLLFSKRNEVYGLSTAKSDIRKEDEVFVVEGYMDAIALHQGGFGNVVASMGTSLTAEQARAISRYTRRVILAYDADSAGAAATAKGIEIFEKAGLYVKIMDIPRGEDPDSIITKRGADFFRRLSADSRGIIEYKIDNLHNKYSLENPEEKQEFFKELIPILREIKGDVRKMEYIRILAERNRFSEQMISRAVFGQRKARRITDDSPVFQKKLRLPEEIILHCMLGNPGLIPVCREYEIDGKCMEKPNYELFRVLTGADLAGIEILSVDTLSRILENESQLKTAIDLSVKEGATDCNEEKLRILLREIQHKKVEAEERELFQRRLREGTLTHDDPLYQKYILSFRGIKARHLGSELKNPDK